MTVALLIGGDVEATVAQEPPSSAGVIIAEGFLTGNEYRELDEGWKRAYVMGWLDGMFLSPVMGGAGERLRWLEECVRDWTDDQLRAVVDLYLREHPVEWSDSMNLLMYRALLGACPRGGYAPVAQTLSGHCTASGAKRL